MRNSKLVSLDLMHVDALNTTDLVSTAGGETTFSFKYDCTRGTYDANGKRVPASYAAGQADGVIKSDILKMLFGGGTKPAS